MNDNNNNFEQMKSAEDFLKVENLDKNEYIVTAAVIEPPAEKLEKKPKKVTLFGAVISAISLNKSDDLYIGIRPVKTIISLIMILFFTILLYFFYHIADTKLVLAVIVFFGAIAIPLLLMTLNYEISPKKNVSFYNIILSFLFGLMLYLAIDALVTGILIKTIYRSTIDSVIVPVLWGIGELVIVAILAKVYNITDLSSGILLSVSVGMGYAAALALHGLIGSLFIPVEVIIDQNTTEHYIGSAILDNLQFTQQSIKNTMGELIWLCFYYPVCICSWSIVIGNVIVKPIQLAQEKKEGSISVYLLLVLVISLYMLSNFATTFNYFDSVLKIISIITSIFIAVRTVNYAMNKGLNLIEE